MYSLYLISNKPDRFEPVVKSLAPERVTYYDGSEHKSFSHLVNRCVASAGTETVILMSDRVMPTREHVHQTVELLNHGYGLVALYRFAFFGFKKEVMRQIGMMDENFLGGGMEDEDFIIRLVSNNIAIYVTHDVPYTPGKTSWSYDYGIDYFYKKWKYDGGTHTINRGLPDWENIYNLGPGKQQQWLPAKECSIVKTYLAQYFFVGLNNKL